MNSKLYICILPLFVFATFSWGQSACDNIDFENGSAEGWNTSGSVVVVDSSQRDPYGDFSLATSGRYAVKLGQKDPYGSPGSADYLKSSVSREIEINEDNRYFIYSFAIVLLGYPHSTFEASYIELEVKDESGAIVPCTAHTLFAQSEAGEGFFKSPLGVEGNISGECCYPIYYMPWKLTAIDLKDYIGQTLTFTIRNSWCIYNIDWGYAYLDAFCSDQIVLETPGCGDEIVKLTAINGMDEYIWSGPGFSGLNTDELSISEVGIYTLNIPTVDPNCPPLEYQFEIDSLPERLTVGIEMDTTVCTENAYAFVSNSSSSFDLLDFQWDFGDGGGAAGDSVSYTYPNDGDYTVELHVTDANGCVDSASVPIKVILPPQLILGSDTVMCIGEEVLIRPEYYQGGDIFSWSTGDSTEATVITEPQELQLTLSNGICSTKDSMTAHLHKAYVKSIPNVITANQDQVNDIHLINHYNVVEYDMTIYNRWGNVVFETSDSHNFWDGMTDGVPVKEGVYFYDLKYRLICEEELSRKVGYIHVVR